MVKETVKSTVGATAPAKAGTSVVPETIPVALSDGLGKMLQEFIKNDTSEADGTASSKHSCGEEIESELLDVVEKVMLGTLTSSQFVALLKSVDVTAEKKVINVSIANVLWLWGTQVRFWLVILLLLCGRDTTMTFRSLCAFDTASQACSLVRLCPARFKYSGYLLLF